MKETHRTTAEGLPDGTPARTLYARFLGKSRGQRVLSVFDTGARIRVRTFDPKVDRVVVHELRLEDPVEWWYTSATVEPCFCATADNLGQCPCACHD